MRDRAQRLADAPVFLLGMPRSGTTWLSQIVEASPDFVVRLSPNYAYPLKDRLDASSDAPAWREVLAASVDTDDPFMTQNWRRDTGELPRHSTPRDAARLLAVKDTRFLDLYAGAVDLLPAAQVLFIVRHPCGVLDSWRHSDEFPAGADFATEWRHGACRKRGGRGELWGFSDWCATARQYLAIEARLPRRVRVFRYEDLVRDPHAVMTELLARLGVRLGAEIDAFLRTSRAFHDERPYAVFKSPRVADAWRTRFPEDIARTIEEELAGTDLARFLA
jgi:hypothetical protein